MIAHEEAQEREEKLGVMRARIRMLQQAVAHNPVAVKVLEFFAEYGGKKPLTELARRLQLPADDVYDAKQLIEKHARHIFASTQGEDQ